MMSTSRSCLGLALAAALALSACEGNRPGVLPSDAQKTALQGSWAPAGSPKRAFFVEADTILFAGDKPYLYELRRDTLFVQYSSVRLNYPILRFEADSITLGNPLYGGEPVTFYKMEADTL